MAEANVNYEKDDAGVEADNISHQKMFRKHTPEYDDLVQLCQRKKWKIKLPRACNDPDLTAFFEKTGFSRAQVLRKFREFQLDQSIMAHRESLELQAENERSNQLTANKSQQNPPMLANSCFSTPYARINGMNKKNWTGVTSKLLHNNTARTSTNALPQAPNLQPYKKGGDEQEGQSDLASILQGIGEDDYVGATLSSNPDEYAQEVKSRTTSSIIEPVAIGVAVDPLQTLVGRMITAETVTSPPNGYGVQNSPQPSSGISFSHPGAPLRMTNQRNRMVGCQSFCDDSSTGRDLHPFFDLEDDLDRDIEPLDEYLTDSNTRLQEHWHRSSMCSASFVSSSTCGGSNDDLSSNDDGDCSLQGTFTPTKSLNRKRRCGSFHIIQDIPSIYELSSTFDFDCVDEGDDYETLGMSRSKRRMQFFP